MEDYKLRFLSPASYASWGEGEAPTLMETVVNSKATVLLGLSGTPGKFSCLFLSSVFFAKHEVLYCIIFKSKRAVTKFKASFLNDQSNTESQTDFVATSGVTFFSLQSAFASSLKRTLLKTFLGLIKIKIKFLAKKVS